MNRVTREFVNSVSALITPVIAERHHPDRPYADAPGVRLAVSGDSAELMLYGMVGGDGWFSDGFTASDTAGALADAGSRPINVRINSNGGDAFEGTAIYTQLMRYPGTVTTYVDGIATPA